MGLQGLVRWLFPKEEHFYNFLERQAVAAHDGASALAAFKAEGASRRSSVCAATARALRSPTNA
jgi:hypothetical protein